jgi:hypothetical protein
MFSGVTAPVNARELALNTAISAMVTSTNCYMIIVMGIYSTLR